MIGKDLKKPGKPIDESNKDLEDAKHSTGSSSQLYGFVPGVPFSINPRQVVLLWDDYISHRNNKPLDAELPKEVKIWDIQKSNSSTTGDEKFEIPPRKNNP